MTIKEAIKHCNEVSKEQCNLCGDEHKQLAEWLTELIELIELRKHQQVSVKDMLPERRVQVLVTDGYDMDTGNLSVDGWWHLDDSISCDCLGDITHWQPLPEPPKEREENAR